MSRRVCSIRCEWPRGRRRPGSVTSTRSVRRRCSSSASPSSATRRSSCSSSATRARFSSAPRARRSSGGSDPSSRSARTSGALRPEHLDPHRLERGRVGRGSDAGGRVRDEGFEVHCGRVVYLRGLRVRPSRPALRRLVPVGHRGHPLLRRTGAARRRPGARGRSRLRAGWRCPRRSPACRLSASTARP